MIVVVDMCSGCNVVVESSGIVVVQLYIECVIDIVVAYDDDNVVVVVF